MATFVGSPDAAVEAAFRGIQKAAELIDMRKQKGAHPRNSGIAQVSMNLTNIEVTPLHAACDGSESAARRLERVLTSDPGMGIIRHVDAGYSRAIDFARENNVQIPLPPVARD